MEHLVPTKFTGQILAGVTPINNQISKARLMVFYKGVNRNGSYITDEFADKLITTLPYTPVVGIFDEETSDFKGHSFDPNEARIYGVVPQEPNVGWEKHVDKDGFERTYMACDVFLYTGRLDRAREISGHPHSMELDPNTISGQWVTVAGQEVFQFTDAAFLGLSVLGHNVEPCFEGSAFYDLVTQFSQFMLDKNSNDGGIQMALENLEQKKVLEGDDDAVQIQATDRDTSVEMGGSSEGGVHVEQGDPMEFENDDTAAEASKKGESDNDAASDAAPATDGDFKKDDEKKDEEDKPDDSDDTDKEDDKPDDSDDEKKKKDEDFKKKDEDQGHCELSGEEYDAYCRLVAAYSTLAVAEGEISKIKSENLELSAANDTLKSEAATQKAEYDDLKGKYEALETERKAEERQKKLKRADRYSAYISNEKMEALKADVDKFDLDSFEKELLFASRDALVPNENADSAPTAFTGPKVDGVEALLLKAQEKRNN